MEGETGDGGMGRQIKGRKESEGERGRGRETEDTERGAVGRRRIQKGRDIGIGLQREGERQEKGRASEGGR